MKSPFLLFGIASLMLLAILFLSLLLGSVTPSELLLMLRTEPQQFQTLVWELRWPRALAAIFCGGMLALAGGLLQIQLRNPLADPYVLGLSAAAGFGALLAATLNLLFWMLLFAGGMALLSLLMLFVLAGPAGRISLGASFSYRIILLGAMLSALFGAANSLLLTMIPEMALRGLLFWLMGDLNGAHVPWWMWGVFLLASSWAWRIAPDLGVMARDPLWAQSLGVSVRRRQWQLVAVAAGVTACVVTVGGAIGFVGLVVPHLLRHWFGNAQRVVLPLSIVFGAALLLLCDTLARTALAPIQLPVGVVTALLGAPVFIWLLMKKRAD